MTSHKITTNFIIPKRLQKNAYRLKIQDTVFEIKPCSNRALKFTQKGPNPSVKKGQRNLSLEWIQESVEHLRFICSL